MFNLQPGAGLGFTASQLLAFGLGAKETIEVLEISVGGGYSTAGRTTQRDKDIMKMVMSLPKLRQDDDELMLLIQTLMESGLV